MGVDPLTADILQAIAGSEAREFTVPESTIPGCQFTHSNIESRLTQLFDARNSGDQGFLAKFHRSPLKLSSKLREYVDSDGTVYLVDDEDRESEFSLSGFVSAVELPTKIRDLARR